jgi:hypothetical protein
MSFSKRTQFSDFYNSPRWRKSNINRKGGERKLGNALFVSFVYIPVYFSKLSIGHDVQDHMLFRLTNNEMEIL